MHTVMSSGPAAAGDLGVARRILGKRLRALRDERRITRHAAGTYIDSSPSKISRIELGTVAVKEEDLDRLLTLYGVADSDERLAYLTLGRHLTSRPWWYPHRDLLPGWFCSYLVFESVADQIRTYENRFVPGLLQTRGYAEFVIRQNCADGPELQRRVDARMDRQRRILDRMAARSQSSRLKLSSPKPLLWAVIDAATLSNHIAGAAVMREQIDFLVWMAEQDQASIQVLPTGSSAIAAAANSFSTLRLLIRNLQDVVYLEQLDSALFLDDPYDCDPYKQAWSLLSVAAREPQDSVKLLREAEAAY